MENDQCILIKKKDYEVLIGNQEKTIKKYTDENFKLNGEIFELKERIKELENTPPKIKVNPLKLEVVLREIYTGYTHDYYGNTRPGTVQEYSRYSATPINFDMDKNLSKQILSIVGLISKKLFLIKEEKESDMRTKLVKLITYEIQQECYKKLANMNWLNRIDFLRKYKRQ